MVVNKNEKVEIELLLEAVFRCSGYDFRNYSRESLGRRLHKIKTDWKAESISELIPKAIHDPGFLSDFAGKMSVSVTEMFRDPEFYSALRKEVIPVLKTYPFLKIWNAGCATGEEAYTMAILLEEENISSKVQIYATDFNNTCLSAAVSGKMPGEKIPNYSENHKRSGGKLPFSSYYTLEENTAALKPKLLENILFTYHNLATDGSFGEMNMILCRNVLIYFDKKLQNKVLKLFKESLCDQGLLCLGTKESLDFSEVQQYFEVVDKNLKIYRKLPNYNMD